MTLIVDEKAKSSNRLSIPDKYRTIRCSASGMTFSSFLMDRSLSVMAAKRVLSLFIADLSFG